MFYLLNLCKRGILKGMEYFKISERGKTPFPSLQVKCSLMLYWICEVFKS